MSSVDDTRATGVPLETSDAPSARAEAIRSQPHTVQDTIREIEGYHAMFGKFERAGDVLNGRCPFHLNASEPTLSIFEDETGDLNLKCTHGCDADAVLAEFLRRQPKVHLLKMPHAVFPILPDYSLAELPQPDFLIDSVLPARCIGELHGHPGTGKTFVALSMALSIATGRQWLGRNVRRGPVLYVAGEGKAGLFKRVEAWKAHYAQGGSVDVYFLGRMPELLSDGEVSNLVDSIDEMSEPPALIVFDTLARCMVGGDENSSRHMSTLVQAADRLRDEVGATVLFIHHSLKNGEVERGSSALRGAMDVMFSIRARGEDIEFRCEKMKDADEFQPFRLGLIQSGGSCVVVQRNLAQLNRLTAVSPKERVALETLAAEGTCNAGDWERLSALPPRTFFNVLRSLKDKGLIEKTGPQKRATYCLSKFGEEWLAANCQTTASASASSKASETAIARAPLGAQMSSNCDTEIPMDSTKVAQAA